ncbi:aldose epimerase [Escherichia coli]|nr:aldose epimerase [Escherichia coli]
MCDFACKNGGRVMTRKSELLSAQYSGLITSLKGKRSMAYY